MGDLQCQKLGVAILAVCIRELSFIFCSHDILCGIFAMLFEADLYI